MHASIGAVDAVPNRRSAQVESVQALHDDGLDTDAVLVTRLAAGDTAALEILYGRHYEPALAVALGVLRDRTAAEDLVHEAFLRAWRRAASFRTHRGTFRSWLLTIVRNAAIDQLRQQAIQRRPAITAAQEALHTAGDLDVSAQVMLSLEAETLYLALAHLAPEQRSAIHQAFFSELSHREISEREGLPLGTVKGRVRLGLHRLRTLLDTPGCAARTQ